MEKIANTPEDTGRAGCNYGDTDFDSLSAVYGYNLCLSYMKQIATAALAAPSDDANQDDLWHEVYEKFSITGLEYRAVKHLKSKFTITRNTRPTPPNSVNKVKE